MNLKSKKGFTLIELIIVIAILGIIALIAVPNLAGIRQRSQVSADKRTAEQIGKAVRIWLTDVDADAERKIPASPAKYDDNTNLPGLCDTYISKGYKAESLAGGTAGDYYVTAYGEGDNNANQKIYIYIGTAAPSAPAATGTVGYDGSGTVDGTKNLAYVEK